MRFAWCVISTVCVLSSAPVSAAGWSHVQTAERTASYYPVVEVQPYDGGDADHYLTFGPHGAECWAMITRT